MNSDVWFFATVGCDESFFHPNYGQLRSRRYPLGSIFVAVLNLLIRRAGLNLRSCAETVVKHTGSQGRSKRKYDQRNRHSAAAQKAYSRHLFGSQ